MNANCVHLLNVTPSTIRILYLHRSKCNPTENSTYSYSPNRDIDSKTFILYLPIQFKQNKRCKNTGNETCHAVGYSEKLVCFN